MDDRALTSHIACNYAKVIHNDALVFSHCTGSVP